MKNPRKVFLSGFLIFLSCTIKKPVTPSWDSHFEVPLLDKKYMVEEIFEEAENVIIDHQSDAVILNIEKIKTYKVGKFLSAKSVWDQNQIALTSVVPGSTQILQDTLIMEDSFLIVEAEFDTGYVKVEIQSSSTIQSQIDIPSLSKNGVPFSLHVSGGRQEEMWDLTGFTFRPLIKSNRNYMSYQVTMQLVSGSSPIVNVKIDLSELRYRKITGWLNQTEVALDDTFDTGIKVSEEFKGIQMGSVLLDFTIFNGVQFPVGLDVSLTGMAKNGQTATLHVTESIPPSGQKVTQTYEARDLINLLPESLILSGHAKLGDGQTYAVVSKYDSIKVKTHVQSPLIFSLPSRENKTEVDTIEMEKDAREFIRDNLTSAALVFEIENHLPIGAQVEFYFSRIQGDSLIYFNPELLKTIDLSPAPTDKDSGTVTDPGLVVHSVLDTISFSLSQQEVQVFDAPEVYMGIRLTFPGTKGVVKIRATDWIKVRCRIEADVRAEFEKEEKGGGS